MKPEIVALCEYASEHNGRLSISETFDAIGVKKLPWRAYFYVAVKIELDSSESGVDYKKITLRIVEAADSSNTIFETADDFHKPDGLRKLNIIAGLRGLIFEKTGEYRLQVYMDTEKVVDHTFYVVEKND